MISPAISARGLGKQYHIGARRERYRMLRATIEDAFRRPFRARLDRSGENASTQHGAAPDTIWALKDVSFDVQPGEVVGVIGRNGAGKSTLLKILSQIVCPTEGEVQIRGRVGSLLEVGTGFHPELTGRENIFLNGAILGMQRAEIVRKFDEIVDFAEVSKFIDTPVKHYSSGMYVRLAFAVAAHLEPDILIVDEVLAVGDAQFQKKCLGKMGDVARSEGRTILFVSHNLAAIQVLCQTTMVIESGRIHCVDESSKACERYIRLIAADQKEPGVVSGTAFQLTGIRVEGEGGRMPAPLQPATVTIPVHFRAACTDPHVHLFVQTTDGETIFGLNSGELLGNETFPAGQDFTFVFTIARLPLLPGTHVLVVKIRSYELNVNETLHIDYRFDVAASPVYGTATPSRYWHGLVAVDAAVKVVS